MIKVLFVCLGNICRSPLAEGVFVQKAKNQNVNELFFADSAGTASYHIGKLPDIRSRQVAQKNGFELTHLARAFKLSDFYEFDFIIFVYNSQVLFFSKFIPYFFLAFSNILACFCFFFISLISAFVVLELSVLVDFVLCLFFF